MALAVAAYRDAEVYRAAVMEKWGDAEKDKDEYRRLYYEQKERNAVLEERQRGRGPQRRGRQYALVLGGLVAGSGLSWALSEKSLSGVGGILLVVGLAVLWLGCPLFVKEE